MIDQNYKEILHNIVIPSGLSYEEQFKRYQPLVDFLQTETPPSLYRFRRCNENSISAFDQDQIWFTTGSEMNDTFDALLFIDKHKIQASLDCFFDTFKNAGIPDGILNLLPHDLIPAVQTRLDEIQATDLNTFKEQIYRVFTNCIRTDLPQIQRIVQSVIKFACFSESIDSAAMWGYYADSGKGFALAYDFRNQSYTNCSCCEKKATCLTVKICSLFRMIYEDVPFDATEYGTWLLQTKIARNILASNQLLDGSSTFQKIIPCPDEFMYTKALLHKATSWSHEREWRLTYSCENQVDEQSKYAWARKLPSALYLGPYISPINEKILRHIAVEKNMPIYKMGMNKDEFSYRLVPQQI